MNLMLIANFKINQVKAKVSEKPFMTDILTHYLNRLKQMTILNISGLYCNYQKRTNHVVMNAHREIKIF